MEEKKVFKTEAYNIWYIIIGAFFISILAAYFFSTYFFFSYNEKIIYDYKLIRRLIILFLLFFILYFTIFLLMRRKFNYYIKEGKLIFKSKNGKTKKFNLKSIYKIDVRKNLLYKSIKIEEVGLNNNNITFLIKKDYDFISWLKSEVDEYKNKNSEEIVKIEYKTYEKEYPLDLQIYILGFVNFINVTFLRFIVHYRTVGIISIVSSILLIVYSIKIIKIRRNNKDYSL